MKNNRCNYAHAGQKEGIGAGRPGDPDRFQAGSGLTGRARPAERDGPTVPAIRHATEDPLRRRDPS